MSEPEFKSSSYTPDPFNDCFATCTEDRPCWGEVTMVDEFWDSCEDDRILVFACKGHADMCSSGIYNPEPKEE